MWELLQRLMKDEKLKDLRLVGGTALSLMIDHRLRIDIDLFTIRDFDEQAMLSHLKDQHQVKIRKILENTVLLDLGQVKVDIISHWYPWQETIQTEKAVRLLSLYFRCYFMKNFIKKTI